MILVDLADMSANTVALDNEYHSTAEYLASLIDAFGASAIRFDPTTLALQVDGWSCDHLARLCTDDGSKELESGPLAPDELVQLCRERVDDGDDHWSSRVVETSCDAEVN